MTTYTQGEVLFFKLVSGEELVGEYVSQNSEEITFKNMILCQFVPNNQGQVGIQFLPYPISADENVEITIRKTGIVLMPFEPDQNLMNAYNQKYGSGLQVVSNPGILHS